MRPPISLPTARTLLSVRYASTASEGSASSLASAYGKGSTARARQQQSAPSSFQQRNEDQSDDFDASVGGMAEESSNLDDGGARALPLFKYHGNWGVPKTPVSFFFGRGGLNYVPCVVPHGITLFGNFKLTTC